MEDGGRVETIQTTALLRKARILRRVLETWGDLLHSDSSEKPSANADVKSSNEWIIINYIKEITDKTQQNSKCRLCSDRDEKITFIISECSNLLGKSKRLDTTRWSIGNYARNWSLTMNRSRRMVHTNSCGILRYKRIT